MAEPKGPETGKDATGGHSARPRSPTLDLAATDVTPKPASGSASGGAKTPGGAKPDQAAEPQAKQADEKPSADKPATVSATSSSAASTSSASAQPASDATQKPASAAASSASGKTASAASGAGQPKTTAEPPKPAPSAASASSTPPKPSVQPDAPQGGGVSLFLGALIGALAGAALALLGVALFGRELIGQTQPADPLLPALQSRLESVSQDLAKLRASVANAQAPADTSAIEAKIGTVQKTVEGSDARIAAIEGEQKSLADKLAKPAQTDPAITAIQGRLDGLEIRLQQSPSAEAIDVIDGRLAGIEARTKELPSKETLADLSVRMDDIAESVEGIGQKIGAATAPLSSRVDQIANALKAQPKGDPAARLVVGLGALSQALSDGRPFASELDAVKAASGGNAELSVLDPYAAKGLASREALGAELAAEIAKLSPPKAAVSGSILERFVANAGGIVKVTPTDSAAAGSDPSAVRAKVSALGSSGDIEGALAARGQLDEAARAATEDWAARASALVSAENAIRAAQTAALARLNSND